MIKSKIWSDISAPDKEATAIQTTDRNKEVWILLASMAAVSAFIEILRPNGLQPLDLFIFRPIFMLGGLFLSAVWLKIWLKQSNDAVWESLKSCLPWGLLGGLVMGLLDFWPRDLDSLPLSLGSMPGYFFSLGFWPLISGPESILRGFVFGLALSFILLEFKRNRNDIRAALGGVGVWLAGSLVLVLPSLILNLLAIINHNPVLGITGSELAANFSRLNINTFWSNLQLTRWFTGFGGQLPNSMALFTLSWVFILLILLSVFLFWRKKPTLQMLKIKDSLWPLLFFVTAVMAGLLAGWGKLGRSWLDLVAWMIFAVLFVLWFWQVKKWSEPDRQDGFFAPWLTPLVFLTGGLLGWPVLLPIIAGLFVLWIKNNWSYGRREWIAWPGQIFLWFCLAGSSLGFMRGSQYIQEGMALPIVAFGISMTPAIAWTSVKNKPRAWIITILVWMAASLLSGLLLKTFLVSALALLGIVASWLWPRFKANFGQWLPYVVLIYMSLGMILAFWLPRWLNPRLLPL